MPDAPTDGLNPDQFDAVVHGGGPLLVVAGAGSGKTRVLTHRIAHLIDEGVHPGRILAITFTNKAADEMRQRVEALVGPVVRSMWVSTFHSACVRILRANADRLGYPRQFSIYDQADAVRLTGYVIRDLALDAKRFPPRGVHAVISLWKNELVDPDTATARAENVFDRKRADVYREYQARLLKAGAMDFDDLLVNTVTLFRNHPDVLESYRERFEHILVDEYQDTNQSQNEIVLMLAGGHQNVTVVGDTDQSVYRFRGADYRNILQFEDAFPEVTTVVLDQNYRSTQNILDAANAVIANNVSRKPKNLWTDAGRGDLVVRYWAEDEGDEATFVARQAIAAPRRRAGVARPRRAVPHQRPEPGRRGGDDAPRRPVQGRRRHPVLRPPRGQGRDGVPPGGRQPGRRGEPEAGAQRAQAWSRRRERRQARRLCRGERRRVRRGVAPSRRCRGHRAGHAGDRLLRRPARPARRDGDSRSRTATATEPPVPATSCRRRWRSPGTSPSSRRRTPSSRRAGWRTSPSSSGRRASSPASTSSSNRSRSSPTPTNCPTVRSTTRSCC